MSARLLDERLVKFVYETLMLMELTFPRSMRHAEFHYDDADFFTLNYMVKTVHVAEKFQRMLSALFEYPRFECWDFNLYAPLEEYRGEVMVRLGQASLVWVFKDALVHSPAASTTEEQFSKWYLTALAYELNKCGIFTTAHRSPVIPLKGL